jgi:hypothetical protein
MMFFALAPVATFASQWTCEANCTANSTYSMDDFMPAEGSSAKEAFENLIKACKAKGSDYRLSDSGGVSIAHNCVQDLNPIK